MNNQTKSKDNPWLWRIQLSSLLLIVAIFAVLSAWFVDHRNLRSQIKPPETKFTVVYQLQNASAARVTSELSRLYPDQRFIVDSTAKSTSMTNAQQNQSVIVVCDASIRDQIGIIIRYFDRNNTDMIEIETVAQKQTDANRQ